MTRDELVELMSTCGLEQSVKDKVLPLGEIRDSVAIFPDAATAPFTGGSKVGGLPDFATKMEWPSHRQRPYLFVGQIALSELQAGCETPSLPSRGVLHFFLYDEEYPPRGKVLFDSNELDLIPCPAHNLLPASAVPTPTRLVISKRQDIILPLYESAEFSTIELTEEERYAFEDFEYDVLGDSSYNKEYEGSKLVGEWTGSAKIAFGAEPTDGWQVLAVFDPFQDERWTSSALSKFPGVSRTLYYFIPEPDLTALDFSRVRVSFGES